MEGLTVTMEVTYILCIRADVAAVKVRQIEGTPLFVMAKEDEQWLLVACQNTGVLDS